MRRSRVVVGLVAVGLAVSGCGGTRVSDAAIEAAAGIVPPAHPTAVPHPTALPAAPAQRPAQAANVVAVTKTTVVPPPVRIAKPGPAAVAQPSIAPVAPQPITKKSVVKLGSVGTFSGPVGGLVKDTVAGERIWAQAVNAAGGINGHPVQLLVGDDGGDPGRFNSIVQQFVERNGVIAFLFNTLAFAPNGNNKYLDAKKIFTFSETGSLEVDYHDPYVLSPAPSGYSYADAMLLSFGTGIGAKGGVKLASYACSDFSLCDNFDHRWSDKEVLRKAGFDLVARGRPSLTQPDYTAQCLAARQAGATAIIVALDGSSIRRFAGDCARQNYHPTLSSADLVITADLLNDANVDGLVVGAKMVPFPDNRVLGLREAHAAFDKYAPGAVVTGGYAYGWLIGEFFAQAARNLPDNPTPADVENGVYSIKSNNLKGMTYPITMTRGKPIDRQLCFGTVIIRGGKFVAGPGAPLKCAKGGRPMSSPDDYEAIA